LKAPTAKSSPIVGKEKQNKKNSKNGRNLYTVLTVRTPGHRSNGRIMNVGNVDVSTIAIPYLTVGSE